jgi:hypothetical protein
MLEIGEELGPKKSFVWAIEWPGWCRSGRTAEAAREQLVAVRPRYATVASAAGDRLPAVTVAELEVVESVTGSSGTDFGVPSAIVDDDRRPVSVTEAKRLAALVEAAWTTFARVASQAPDELRKGPRGGGRDTAKMIGHVVEADSAYAREIGIKHKPPEPGDVDVVAALRRSILEVLNNPSDGSPLAGRKWPLRYAARRIAWHALDHAWEIEDRTEL